MISSALPLVTTQSDSALTAPVLLMYVTVWNRRPFSRSISWRMRQLWAGQLSASEQPASMSGSSTFFSGLSIFAVSAMKSTPQKTMVSVVTVRAAEARASFKLSPVKSARSWNSPSW